MIGYKHFRLLPLPALVVIIGTVACVPGADPGYTEPSPSYYEEITASIDVGGTATEVAGAKVEAAFFDTAGVAPLLGRLFVDAEHSGDADPAVIVSEAFWRESLGAAPTSIGTSLVIDGSPRVLVGVMPQGFDSPPGARFWIAGPPPAYVIRDVRVFDGDAVIPIATVVIEAGVITQVAAAGREAAAPAGAEVVDGTGKTLLPGLIDAHTHNSSRTHLKTAVGFATTTNLDMFTDPEFVRTMKLEEAGGRAADRADIFSAGILVTAPDGHGTQYGVDIPTLSSPGDADAFVAARIADGSDFIKIVYDDGRGFGLSRPTLDEATLRATIDAAHARDKLAVVHIGSHEYARTAIEAGADGLVHIFADEPPAADFGDLAARHGVFVVPTLAVIESGTGVSDGVLLTADPNLAPLVAPALAAILDQRLGLGDGMTLAFDNALAAVGALHDAGVPLLAGTDAPNPGTYFGVSMHRELELLVRAGLTPLEALVAATSAAADAFGLDDRGRIAPGMRADLWIAGGDPTTSILDSRAIDDVWKEGRRWKLHLMREDVARLRAEQ